VFLKDPRIVLDLVALADDGKACIEGCSIEGSCRCDDGDPVAGAKRARLVKDRLW
jgi:hypothetical protein